MGEKVLLCCHFIVQDVAYSCCGKEIYDSFLLNSVSLLLLFLHLTTSVAMNVI